MQFDAFYARTFALLATLALGYALWLIFAPFMSAIAWAAFLALILFPLNVFLRMRLRGSRVAAALVITVLTPIVILAPVSLLATAFVSQARALVRLLQDSAQRYHISSVEDLRQFPWAARSLEWLQTSFGISVDHLQSWAVEHLQELLQRFAGLGGAVFLGALGTVIGFMLMLFVLFFLLRDGDIMAEHARALIPLPAGRKEPLIEHIVAVIRAVVFGTGITATLQGVMVGIGFAVVGLPSPVVFGALAALLAMLPVGGTAFVWVPAVLSLALASNRWGAAIGLFVWGILLSTLDNVLRPYLISGRAQVSTLAVFLGVVGGLSAFGPIGLVLGPVIVSLAIALLRFLEEEQRSHAA
jgi:predicted PurR-regulated permease PerM